MRRQVKELTEGEYAIAKAEVDKLRKELGLEETKSLETQLEEKSSVLVSFDLPLRINSSCQGRSNAGPA